jgi:hypothetical protein
MKPLPLERFIKLIKPVNVATQIAGYLILFVFTQKHCLEIQAPQKNVNKISVKYFLYSKNYI